MNLGQLHEAFEKGEMTLPQILNAAYQRGLLVAQRELLKQTQTATWPNGYPFEAVGKATILMLPQLCPAETAEANWQVGEEEK